MKILIAFLIFLTLAAIGSAVRLWRVKKRLSEMTGALRDVRDGNGNRRLLAGPSEPIAPLAYEMNEIVRAYEDRLAQFRQTAETNKRLMTSLSHDVRTPLTTLIGYLDAAQKGIVTGEEREEYLETARRKAYDLKAYIDVLFDWFKLNSDEFVMEIVPVEAGELTRNILIDWIPIFESQGIAVEIDIAEESVPAALDSGSYTRILNNLIQNLVSHSRADRVEARLSKRDDCFEFTLSDNGVGIAKEALDQVFNRLYTRDPADSERGSGLGLSIARQLAGKMGGRISAESRVGEGTSFTLAFPLIRTEALRR